MTVYVDRAVNAWRGKLWCHLFSADIEELHTFARRLGLLRAWHQEPPNASWPHYDVTAVRRVTAVRLGALEADRRTLIAVSHDARIEWCRANRQDLLPDAMARRARWRAVNTTPVRVIASEPAQDWKGDLFG
jgi:hypothetical protein